MSSITQQIESALARIEREHDCAIVLAIESGSRAWGFASTDSDWDVRFVYVHRAEHYLSIEDKRDVIDRATLAAAWAS
jgi:predicted nucleotidyltransferase